MVVSLNNLVRLLILITVFISFIFLRISLIFVYPLIVLFLFYALNLRLKVSHIFLITGFIVVGLISSSMEGLFLSNYFFSEYLILPLFVFLISKIHPRDSFTDVNFFDYFIKVSTVVLIIVNISAFIYAQFIVDTGVQNYEDAFTGLYGEAGFGSHSLSVINLGFSVFFLYRKAYLKFLFFLICGVMGYYGLGLIVFVLALLLLYATKFFKYWRVILMLVIAGLAVVWFINKFNARNLDYIRKNLEQTMLVFENYDYDEEMQKAQELKVTEIPRFLIFLDGAQKRFFSNPKVGLLGTSPGGYNSRTAFYLNGDFVQNKFLLEHFDNQTVYHEEDIFPLLNRELISRPFNDGTRNQTFSSIIAIFMEYGIFLGLIFWVMFYNKIRGIARCEPDSARSLYIKFLSIYLLLILFVQNYLEYPEIVLPFILLIKLAEVDRINNSKIMVNAT